MFFLIGIAILVGYAIYTGFISGEEIGKYTIQEFKGRVTTFSGFRLSKGRTVTHQAGPVHLTPDMNPLRMIFKVNTRGMPSSFGIKGLEYTFSIVEDTEGTIAWETAGHFSPSGDNNDRGTISRSFKPFVIDKDAYYNILSNIQDSRTFKPIVTKAEIIIKRNVAKINSNVYIIAGVVTFIAFILMCSGLEKKEQV